MTVPTPIAREQARLILSHEAGSSSTACSPRQAIERALLRLFEVMDPLIGAQGFMALVKRSVHFTHQTHSCLTGLDIQIAAGVELDGLGEALEQQGPDKSAVCAHHLLAMLITLSCAFIGDALTWRALLRAWPDTEIGKPVERQEEP
jgi:hypothetical protein